MVVEGKVACRSKGTAIESISSRIGGAAETLRRRVRRRERDAGVRESPTTAAAQRLDGLEREVREVRKVRKVRRADEILATGTGHGHPAPRAARAGAPRMPPPMAHWTIAAPPGRQRAAPQAGGARRSGAARR
ncbi:MAG: hypothetical protein JSR43_18280 [Proteobacteria bacterium]|jgi:transposase|nr:hypothetical protein [Pseudomonadota bacterium]